MRNTTTELNCYLHIYKVCAPDEEQTAAGVSYVSVASLGASRAQAEQVAINLVHQKGFHILATDTATAAPWLSTETDLPYLEELAMYGAALQELAA